MTQDAEQGTNPDDPYAVSFELILAAGSAKSTAMEAVELAREGHVEEARATLKKADDDFRAAHDIQFELLQREAKQDHVDVDIILVHANDHLTMALMAKDNAEELIELYARMGELTDRLNDITTSVTSKEN